MVILIAVVVTTWIAISTFGSLLMQYLLRASNDFQIVLSAFLIIIASLFGSMKVGELYERWRKRKNSNILDNQ